MRTHKPDKGKLAVKLMAMCDRAGKLTNNDLWPPFYVTQTLHYIPMSTQDIRAWEPRDFKMVESFLKEKKKRSAILTVNQFLHPTPYPSP
jgi:hypothetical protein